MVLEFRPDEAFNFITAFAEKFSLPATEDLLVIPEKLGAGSIRKIQLSREIVVVLHRYRLREDLVLKRLSPKRPTDRITLLFYPSKLPENTSYSIETGRVVKIPGLNVATIEIASNDLSSTTTFPAQKDTSFTVVAISARLLNEYLGNVRNYSIVENILSAERSYFYHEKMEPKVEKIHSTLGFINLQDPLGEFYFRLKIEELIYHLFYRLLKRENVPQQRLNNADVIKIHAIKNKILQDLGTPPLLTELARSHGFSETTMKKLFKQIYGDTIYNYFQSARMEEAAFLLRQSDFSVSEIGYRLGFMNLSHFSRLFKKHYQVTPKKFSAVG